MHLQSSTPANSPTFQCPQQKTKKLPLSRLNDGVCDCCDGADESGPLCEDVCDTVLAAERAAKLKAEKNYEIGSVKRKEALAVFETLVKQTIVEIEKIEQDLKTKDAELELVNTELHEAKLAYADHRRAELLKVLSDMIDGVAADSLGVSGLLKPLTNEELKLFIQLTCQLSGEMEGSVKQKTCVPLRLAGVDLGILWRDEAFKNASVELISIDDDAGRQLHSELVHKNQQGEIMWSEAHVRKEAKPTGRRRLDEYMDDDDDDNFHASEDGYESNDDFHAVHDDYESSDDFQADHDDYSSNDDDEIYQEAHGAAGNSTETVEGTQQKELDKAKAEVEGTVFSRGRMAFLSHADSLVAKIEEFLKAKQDEAKPDGSDDKTNEEELGDLQTEGNKKEDENADVDASGQISHDTDEPPFDPIAYTMAKSTLKRRTQSIRRGLQYALSARILVDAVSSNDDASNVRSNLMNLAGATLMHSRASAEHVWGILSTMLPELERASADDTHICTSPLANLCPPRVISRSGQDYPPPGIRMAGEAACTTAMDEINTLHCGTDASEEILTNIPNGYYGYHEIGPRGEDDVLHLVFSPLRNILATSVSDLEERQRVLDVDKASLEGKLESLNDTIGGRDDHDTFKGELHALKDSCYTVTEGKYDYEVCIFGKAVQKAKGASSGSGTSLGRWKGMSIDDASGDRVMKWINGQKCWNGPERSATAIVRCGAETKLLSAEEPDTCSYLLEMESHIACDDAYFKKYLA